VRGRLHDATTNLAKYYLVMAITNNYISSPGWGLNSSIQLREIKETIVKTTAVQNRVRQNLDFNRTKIDSASSGALFRTFQSCRKEERYAYHSSHSFMNLDSQTVLPECKTIGLAGMLVCALHPKTTMAKVPCFTPERGRKTTELVLYGRDRNREVEMNNVLPGYDEQLFSRLRCLATAMETGNAKSVRMLSQKIQFSAAAGAEIGNIARSLGLKEEAARSLSEQMSNYLTDNAKSIKMERDMVLDDEEEVEVE